MMTASPLRRFWKVWLEPHAAVCFQSAPVSVNVDSKNSAALLRKFLEILPWGHGVPEKYASRRKSALGSPVILVSGVGTQFLVVE